MDAFSRPTEQAMNASRGVCGGISLVLSARDVATTIASTLRAADAALAKLTADYEILLVLDGSADQTPAIANQLAAELPRLRVISHPRILGLGAALRTGIAATSKQQIAIADGDGQYNLAEINRLQILAGDYDLVCGYRIESQDAWLVRTVLALFNLAARLLLGVRVRDGNCGFKLGRADLFSKLDLKSNDDFLHAELLTKAQLRGASMIEVGVTHVARASDRKRNTLRQTIPQFCELLRCWWNTVLFPAGRISLAETRAADTRVRGWHIGLLALVAVFMLFTRLTYPLIEPDEARYALIAAEMHDTGQWLLPQHWGTAYLDKPPLLYWLTAISYRLFGVHDHSARFVAAVAGMGTLIATYLLGRRLIGQRAALLGTLCLLASFGFVLSTRFLIMDGLLTLFTTCALLSIYIATRGSTLDYRWWLAAAVAVGLGAMTKGPVALVLSLPPLFASRWLSNNGARIRWRDWAWFGGAFTLVTAPWFIAATIQDSSFLKYFFWTHHVMRFATTFAHSEPWWFYGIVLVVGLFPTCMLFPSLVIYLRSKSPGLRATRTWEQGYLLLAAVWVVTFFSISRGKLPPYVLPSLPMFCLAMGAMLDRGLLSKSPDALLDVMRRALPFHGTRTVLIACMIVGLVDAVIDGWAPLRWLDGLAITAVAAGLFYYVSRKSFAESEARWIAAAVMPLLLMAVGLIHIYPEIATDRSTAERVTQLQAEYEGQRLPVISYQMDRDSLEFYNRGHETRIFSTGETAELTAYLSANPRVLLVSAPASIQTLREKLPATFQIDEQPDSRHRVYLIHDPLAPSVSAAPRRDEAKR